MRHVVNHDLDMELARRVAKRAWEAYSERFSNYEPRAEWTSEDHAKIRFRAKGITLNGSIDLEPGAIGLDLDVPFILRVFRKQAISVIDAEMQKWIGKAKSGEI